MRTSEIYSDKFQLHVIELKKLDEDFPEEDRELYHWAKLIAADDREVMHMHTKDNFYRKVAFDEMKYISMNPTQRWIYLREQMAIMDENTMKYEARQEGIDEGELRHLILLVQRKIRQGASLPKVIEDLADTEENIRPVYETVLQHPNDTIEQLTELLLKRR